MSLLFADRSRCLTSPRRADDYEVALHFLDRRGCASLRRGYCVHWLVRPFNT
jgi:hypothetical protein